MAIKIGKRSEEGTFKYYKGVGAFNILAVNPTKAQLSEILGRDMDNEPEYLGKDENGNKTIRVTFYAKTNPEAKVNNGIELIVPISFMLTASNRVSQNSGKTQVIDKYGRTAWVTAEDLSTGAIPQYSNGPANLSAGYRPAAIGEEYLVNFLIKWLNIPNPASYKDGKWVMNSNAENSEVSLDIKKLFAGDVSELSELVSMATPYLVKAAVGIRSTDEGKQYHTVFIREFAKNAVTDYSKLDAAIVDFQNNGGAPTTVFSTLPLHENVVEATTFVEKTEDTVSDNPWD